MRHDEPAFRIDQRGNVHIIRFLVGISNRLSIEQMNYEVHGLLEQTDSPQFIVDFSQVREMSSAIPGVIMGIHLKVCRRKGDLRLCGINPELMEVFTLMKLDTILAIDQTVNESLERVR